MGSCSSDVPVSLKKRYSRRVVEASNRKVLIAIVFRLSHTGQETSFWAKQVFGPGICEMRAPLLSSINMLKLDEARRFRTQGGPGQPSQNK